MHAVESMENVRKSIESVVAYVSMGIGAVDWLVGCGMHVLKTNFSVGVSMYSDEVTSYW